jgi:hypothetical protein
VTEEPLEPEPLDAEADPEEPRRYPSTIGGALYIVVLGICGAGIAVVAGGDWRLGVRVLAVGLLVASGLRLLLPSRDAGMLAVRNRTIDVSLLAALGGLLYFLAVTIPDQPS